MGHSLRNFQEFWDIVEKYELLKGGCIWDWVEQGLEKKKEKIIRKLESGKLQLSVHVITLAISEKNQLEIYPTLQFKQPAFPEQDLFVVGITKGYEEAVELVEQIVQEVYEQTGGCDIRSYILEKEQGR